MRIKVEWKDGDLWRSVMVQIALSRRGNWTFKHDGKVYVFKEKKEGQEVLVLDAGKWARVGRVTRQCVFLGEGVSSDEYYQTPQGMKEAQEAFGKFLNDRANEEPRVYAHLRSCH